MKFLASLALRNVLRNRRRSLLTALMVTAGTALLALGQVWITGVLGGAMDQAAAYGGHARITTQRFAVKEQLFPLDENVADTAPLVAAVAKVPGVQGVYPRIQLPVTVTASEEIGDHFGLVQGGPPAWYEKAMELPAHMASGTMFSADDEAVVGKELAEEIGAKVGGEIVVLGQTQDGSPSPGKFTVTGIYDLGAPNQNKSIYVTLEQAQYLADIEGGATEVLVYGSHRDEGPALAAAIRALPEAEGLESKAWSERPPFDHMLGIMNLVKLIATTVIVFITGLGVFNTMLMSVLERTREIGVLRALGQKRFQTVAMFVVEAVGIATVGGLFGAVVGGVVGYGWLERHGINLGNAVKGLPADVPINTTVYGELTPEILVNSFLLGLVMAFVGGFFPALRASIIQPVEAMRTHH